MRVSFIIPVKELNDYVMETVGHLQSLEDGDWEAFVVTNDEEPAPWCDDRISIVASGRVGPADKRDLAAGLAAGDVLVFLDDDSYPESNYMDVLRKALANDRVAVGGPAVTPADDSYWQQVSGAMYLSRLTGGTPERYAAVGAARPVLDWPSVNLAIRKDAFLTIGGFGCRFWPGEDTFLCDKLTRSGVQIWYEPDLLVWHHRRNSLRSHLRQVGSYGLHRGYFARNFGGSSLRASYFAPSGLVGCFMLVLVPVNVLRWVALSLIALYGFTQVVGAARIMRRAPALVALGVLVYSPLSHLWYGVRFLQGLLFTPVLISRLR